MDHQDWKEVKIKKRTPSAPSTKQEVQTALQKGSAEVVTAKRATGGSNKQHSSDFVARSLDQDEGATKGYEVHTVNPAIAKAIIQARQVKCLTQKDLALAIQEKVAVVQQYEQGKAVPNQQVLSKMEKVLGVKLRGLK
eukprot:TRINITY_DN990_c0_g1_i14.p1 TRINITY_DN990_c0_g1~~TRINITY_DN990_c0_g1_i14.p1  ORF type:complete len:154 (-),score=32.79 TRINITY_DN990_c0_g1_i14:152-565(-)